MVRDGARPVVVVTGASAGVGRATVRSLAGRGADLVLLARGAEGLEATAAEVESAGSRALPIACDVADPEAVFAAADAAAERFGRIDAWINDAMVTVMAFGWDLTAEELRRVTEVTYLGTVHGTLAALRHMRPRDRGTIVQVGSALAYRGIPLQAAYCGAKHAIQGFTESLRTDLLHAGSRIRVSLVHLPAVNTPQFTWCRTRLPGRPQPVPPIFQPEVAARAIVWALDHPRRELLVGWPTVRAVWGDRLAPWLVDRFLARHTVDDQQTGEPVRPDRPDNLFAPLEGDRGAHGPFDERARGRSLQLWATTHRATLGAAAIGAAGVALAAWMGGRR